MFVKSSDAYRYPSLGVQDYYFISEFDFRSKSRDGDTGVLTDPQIMITMYLYDEELGSPLDSNHYQGEVGAGAFYWTVYLSIVFVPVEKVKSSNEIVAEFGKYSCEMWRFTDYINLYMGEKCIATCYFDPAVEVPNNWVAEYLEKNLFYGG